jgi:hypothetical protein
VFDPSAFKGNVTVYLASNLQDRKVMAVKEVVRISFSPRSQVTLQLYECPNAKSALNSLHDEWELVRKLQNPHIIRYYAVESQRVRRRSDVVLISSCDTSCLWSIARMALLASSFKTLHSTT